MCIYNMLQNLIPVIIIIIIIIIKNIFIARPVQQAGTARHYRVNKKPKAY